MENVATEEFISRTEALEDFEACNAANPHWTPQRVKTFLLRQPAVDVAEVVHGRWIDGADNTVEIVYCKDCKHKVRTDANGIVICSEEHGMYCPTENDFCSYGEQREE